MRLLRVSCRGHIGRHNIRLRFDLLFLRLNIWLMIIIIRQYKV